LKYVLAQAHREQLRRLAQARPLLAFDYDGTLAPLGIDPSRTRMRATTRGLLLRLVKRFRCAVISGRARVDLKHCLRGVRGVDLIGNHGIEARRVSFSSLRVVQRWVPVLTARLAGCRGVVVENKAFSITVHYRAAPNKHRARALIRSAAAALADARVVAGIQSLNLLPRAAPDKGVALEEARRHAGCDAALFVGDDESDEAVFALGPSLHLLTVRVGRRKGSRAAYFIRNQREIDELLRRLLSL
jgi:trehalose 6-phosphate phosphatase